MCSGGVGKFATHPSQAIQPTTTNQKSLFATVNLSLLHFTHNILFIHMSDDVDASLPVCRPKKPTMMQFPRATPPCCSVRTKIHQTFSRCPLAICLPSSLPPLHFLMSKNSLYWLMVESTLFYQHSSILDTILKWRVSIAPNT